MGHTEVTENDVKDTLHDKSKKKYIRNLLTKNFGKHKMNQQAPQKMAKIIF